MNEWLDSYDFDRRRDEMTADGDIVPIDFGPHLDDDDEPTDDDLVEMYDTPPNLPEKIEDGVFVTLDERSRALGRLAQMYANYARATGMNKAIEIPQTHQELARRYPNPAKIATRALIKAKKELRREPELMEPLLKSQALIDAGFDPADVETNGLITTIQTRHAIGVHRTAADRKRALRSVYVPKPPRMDKQDDETD